MKYQDVLKRFVSTQTQLLQEKQMKQQLKEQMLSAQAQGLSSFIPGMQQQSPEEEYTESEHSPFEEGQEFKAGGIHIDPSKKGTFKAQATRMGMSIQEAASHILNNKEKYSSAMVKKANFAKNFAKEEGGQMMYGTGGGVNNPGFKALPDYVQHNILSNMAYGGEQDMDQYRNGGYTVRRTNERKGKTHVVTGPDGTKKYFGDPNMGERSKSKHGKDAFYARHASNLKNNPYFRAYARATWEEGGMFTGDYEYEDGGLNTTKRAVNDERRGGPMRTHKSEDGTVTNRFMNRNGDEVIQVKTADGKYFEKILNKKDQLHTLNKIQSAVDGPIVNQRFNKDDIESFEERVNGNLGNPEGRASKLAQEIVEEGNDPIDNVRHPFAGRFTAEGAYKLRKQNTPWAPDWMNKGAAWLDANMLGVAHEAGTLFHDERPWNIKLREAAEDIYNNGVGVNAGLSDMSDREKTQYLFNMSKNHQIPDGYGEEYPFRDDRTDPYEKEKGGEMIRRADGSYSKRGLWDNIRDNRGSGKKPTKEMLEQERKIRREFATGGSFNNPGFNALPEAVQDKIIAAMMYGGNVDNNNWD